LKVQLLRAFQHQPSGYHGWLAGITSGITSTLAHGGGSPFSIFLIIQALEPKRFVATAAFYFFVLNWMKVP